MTTSEHCAGVHRGKTGEDVLRSYEVNAQSERANTVRVKAVNRFQARYLGNVDFEAIIIRELSHEIADTILKDELYALKEQRNLLTDTVELQMTVEVLPPQHE